MVYDTTTPQHPRDITARCLAKFACILTEGFARLLLLVFNFFVMVYYIRFLKPPVVSDLDNRSYLVTSVISITTDLGDISLWSNVELLARLVDVDDASTVRSTTRCPWPAGKRTVTIFFTYGKGQPDRDLRVHVTIEDTARSCARFEIPEILDVWSAPFKQNNTGRSASLVERQFHLSASNRVHIWEETGNSIARHIWDAAIGCLQCFQTVALRLEKSELSRMPCLQGLLSAKRTSPLNVLELGAGCGIAGISLANMIPDCSVYLTDLPEAQDMLQKNLDGAKPAKGSSLRLGLLEWGSEIPYEMLTSRIDMVLISDCTYNADSCSALVQTLATLAQHSKDLKILLAMKRRHDAEAVFEYMMESNNFQPLECTKLTVPHRESETDTSRPVVEIYLYEHVTKDERSGPQDLR